MARRKKVGELRSSEVECGYCGKIIAEDAMRCPECGKLFSAAKKMAVFAAVIMVVIAGMSGFVYIKYFDAQQAGSGDLDPINGGNTTTAKTIVFELKKNDAPNTCANFEKYVNDGYFSGLIFHRVIDGFMIQGGGFTPDLTQKSPTYSPINLEISNLKHLDGSVAMARTNDPNSATSQFYICDGPQSSLDGSYAVFGQVTSGMEHVRAISAVATQSENGMDDVPVNDVMIKSAKLTTSGTVTYVTLTVEY